MSFLVACLLSPVAMAEQVNLYSARKEALIKPLLDKFTQQTGIAVNLVTGKADNLITRLKAEGRYSPADLLLTTDVGRLYRAKQQGLTQSILSTDTINQVPADLRDPENHWFGLSLRARPLMVAPNRVDMASIAGLESLTDPQFKGRICVRSSSNIYNQSMLASLVIQLGEAVTQDWATALVKNFARSPQGGDRDQIKAVAAGQCDIAIANTYYLAGMLTSKDSATVQQAQQVKVLWPNQADRGTHVNISGVAVTQHAPNKEAAVKLLEFLLTIEAQQWYAKTNHEYPVLSQVKSSDILQSFGPFKAEQVQLSKLGELNATAVRIMDRAGWK